MHINGTRHVRYTVWSRGRSLGDTDLGFHPIIERCRSGWFHPNADGERLMPVFVALLPAMRAYLHRDAADSAGNRIVQPALAGSSLFADLAEAFQHLSSLDLELRREDGSVVPTSSIGIQDVQHLLALSATDLENDPADPDEHDEDGGLFEPEEWGHQLERYQIHVELVSDEATP
jgi:hypothetical protein